MEQEASQVKVGKVYLRIARKLLNLEYPDLNAGIKKMILERGNLHEIEDYVQITRILGVAAHKFGRMLVSTGVSVPPELFWNLTYAEEPEVCMADFIVRLKHRQFSDVQKSKFIYHILKEVHSEWMDVNEELFFDSKKIGQKCKFMPFELVGFDQVMSYRVYIEDMLWVFGWPINSKQLCKYYLRKQEEFVLENDLIVRRYADDTLVDYLMRAEYPVPPRIARMLRSDRSLAIKMASS